MRGSRRALLVLPVLCSLVPAACNREPFDTECTLVVLNQSTCDARVFVDGREAFTVRAGSDRTLADIGAGRHVLEALDANGNLLLRRVVELATGEDFTWTLERCGAS